MAKGNYLVRGDKTTCGGVIVEGCEDHCLFGKAVSREGDKVTCGRFPGIYNIVGGIAIDSVHGRRMAGTLDSYSSCPCQSRFIASMVDDTYENASLSSSLQAGTTDEQSPVLSSYTTGEQASSGYRSDYPALRNTHDLPDERVRMLLATNNHDVMLLTGEETVEVLYGWGWVGIKSGWVSITQSVPGQWVVNYGVNGRDIVTTAMLISQLGSFSIRATSYINHKGTELIKLSGYPGIRKVLNAPVFAAKNPKIVDLGIGKYGLANSIVEGARLTFYVAAAYRTLDFILNDNTSLAEFMGALATDVVKIGIVSGISWGGGVLLAMTPFVIAPLVGVVVVGLGVSIALNILDEKFGVTDKVVKFIESAQQEFVEKAKEIESGIWDLGAMFVDGMLEKGKQFAIEEIRKYLRKSLEDIIPRGC